MFNSLLYFFFCELPGHICLMFLIDVGFLLNCRITLCMGMVKVNEYYAAFFSSELEMNILIVLNEWRSAHFKTMQFLIKDIIFPVVCGGLYFALCEAHIWEMQGTHLYTALAQGNSFTFNSISPLIMFHKRKTFEASSLYLVWRQDKLKTHWKIFPLSIKENLNLEWEL